MPFVEKIQGNLNLNFILDNKSVKSQLLLQANKFKVCLSYKYEPTIGQIIFNYNKVLSTLSVNNDGDMLAFNCKDTFSKFVYKPHGHVHTSSSYLIENIPLHGLMSQI